MADDEGNNKEGEGSKGDSNGGKGGGQAKVTMATKRARAAAMMATATRVAGNKEGDGRKSVLH